MVFTRCSTIEFIPRFKFYYMIVKYTPTYKNNIGNP